MATVGTRGKAKAVARTLSAQSHGTELDATQISVTQQSHQGAPQPVHPDVSATGAAVLTPQQVATLLEMADKVEAQRLTIEDMAAEIQKLREEVDELRQQRDAGEFGAGSWTTVEPKIKATVKELVQADAVKQVAADAVQQHVQRQTQRVDQLAIDYAKACERGNANAERVLQRTAASNLRIVNVSSDYRTGNKATLVKKTQDLVKKASKIATVVDVMYRTSTIERGGQRMQITNLTVSLQGPAAVEDVISGARKLRERNKDAFPFCDRDLTPAMLQLRRRMEAKRDEWNVQANPNAEGRRPKRGEGIAWITYKEGRPVLLKRNLNDRAGDARGAAQEWIWQSRDPTKPEEGEFILAPRHPQAAQPASDGGQAQAQ
jgi:hypothetical protein